VAWCERALERCAGAADKHWLLGLIVFSGAYAAATIARALVKPLWFDELFTFYIARLPAYQERLTAAVYDGHPPFFYILTHASMRLFGESGLALRLPAIIGFWLLSVSLFLFTRRRLPSIYAFLALVLPLQTLAYSYAIEARPYGIVLGMAGVSLLAWQSAGEARHRWAWLAVLAVSIAVAVSSHFYGVQVVLPLLVGETWRVLERRKVDWGVAGAIVVGVLPVPFLLSVARGMISAQFTRTRMSASFFWKPTLPKLPGFYENLLHPLVVPLALAFIVLTVASLLWREGSDGTAPPRRRMPGPELAAALTYLCIPALMLLGTGLTTGYFSNRYAISAVIGVAVLFPCLLSTSCRIRALAPIACMAGVLLVWGEQTPVPQWQKSGRSAGLTADSPLYPSGDDLPIAVADVLAFPPLAHYSPPQVRARLTYLTDVAYVVRGPRFVAEVSLAGDRQLMPGTIVDYGPFVRTHSKFWVYVVSRPETEWLPSRLMSEGWKLECRGRNGQDYLFLATRE